MGYLSSRDCGFPTIRRVAMRLCLSSLLVTGFKYFTTSSQDNFCLSFNSRSFAPMRIWPSRTKFPIWDTRIPDMYEAFYSIGEKKMRKLVSRSKAVIVIRRMDFFCSITECATFPRRFVDIKMSGTAKAIPIFLCIFSGTLGRA